MFLPCTSSFLVCQCNFLVSSMVKLNSATCCLIKDSANEISAKQVFPLSWFVTVAIFFLGRNLWLFFLFHDTIFYSVPTHQSIYILGSQLLLFALRLPKWSFTNLLFSLFILTPLYILIFKSILISSQNWHSALIN